MNGLGTNKSMAMGPEIKNDCAGEDQQKITVLFRAPQSILLPPSMD
jgi:hypothetical protein